MGIVGPGSKLNRDRRCLSDRSGAETKETTMGYYVELLESDFSVPETPEVLQALKDLNKFDDLKTGGRWAGGGGGKVESWFAWMSPDYDETVTSVAEVFESLGFDVTSEDGAVHLMGYDRKRGSEDVFIARVAPFVKDGSYIVWRGEEGATWRWSVKSGRLMSQEAILSWGTPTPYLTVFFTSANDEDGVRMHEVDVLDLVANRS